MDDSTLGLGMDRGQRTASLFLVIAVLFSCAGPTVPPPERASEVVDSGIFAEKEKDRKPPQSLPVNPPVQVSFEADPVLYAALSGDGNTLAYVLEKQGRSSLWLRPRDPAPRDPEIAALPQKRLEGVGRISAPALSREGGKVTFVATDYDAKGDIYVLPADMAELSPQRLTGRDTADGAPTFSPDGNRIYFHRLSRGEVLPRLAHIDLNAGAKEPETLREGAFPSVSPDGESLAFVSFEKDSGGDIYVLNLKTGKTTPITTGSAQDLYPTWSANGKWIYFSRFNVDTNGDGVITPGDNAIISRVALEDADLWVHPLTSGTFSAYQPMATSSEVLFLSNRNGAGNLWALPLGGQIPAKEDARAQMELARILASRLPQQDALAVLAYHKVLENFRQDKTYGGKAAYEMGTLYQRMGRREQAIQANEQVMGSFQNAIPERALASIRLAEIQAAKASEVAPTDFARKKILKDALIFIHALMKAETSSQSGVNSFDSERIRARGFMAQARLLGELGRDPASLTKAIGLLDQATALKDLTPDLKAEAIFQKAQLNSRMGRASAVAPAYLSVITQYPDTPWADAAVERVIDIHLSDSPGKTVEARIQTLARLAETHEKTAPKLAMAPSITWEMKPLRRETGPRPNGGTERF